MRYESAIGRPIDLRYSSNRFVAAASLVAGAVGVLVGLGSGEGVGSLWWGIVAGGAVFLAWAVGREVDPDHPLAAGVAAVLAPAGFMLGRPGLAATLGALMAARILVRSTGLAPSLQEALLVAGAAVYIATTPAGLPVGVVLGGSLVIDTRLQGRGRRSAAALGVTAIVAAPVAAVLSGTAVPDPVALDAWGLVMVCAGAIAAIHVTLAVPDPTSVGDFTGEPLVRSRLRAARVAATISIGGAVAWSGGEGLAMLAPVWAALVATSPLQAVRARRRPGSP